MGPQVSSTMKGDTFILSDFTYWWLCKNGGETGYKEDVQFPMILAFNNKTVLQRTAVIIAGPLMNLLLAMVLFA